jgi:hypothetical protein
LRDGPASTPGTSAERPVTHREYLIQQQNLGVDVDSQRNASRIIMPDE